VLCTSTDQVVVGPDAKQFSEVTEGDRRVGLKAKVTVVMSGGQVTAFTADTCDTDTNTARDRRLYISYGN